MNNTAALEPGRGYELKTEYRSTDEVSGRDRGSWIYLAYRDAQDKPLGEQCETLEAAASWTSKSIRLKTPAGAAKVSLSIRQQQRKGTLDLKSVELKLADADATAKSLFALSPEAKAGLAQILNPGEKLSPEGVRSPKDGNVFLPYLNGKAPSVLRDLGTETIDGVLVQKVVFRSMWVGGVSQEVYAVIARPAQEGKYPGILWLHGGYGCADPKAAISFAKAGYVAVSPDLPGIASAKLCPNSAGPWTYRASALNQMTVRPDPTASPIFDAEVAALQAFELLSAQPGVLRDRVGVCGISMGGYSTTMISGLLGERVRAAYSIFGCGYYDRGSTWTAQLADLPDDEREAWLHHFDAGRRASNIRAPYFIAAAVRDHFFWPPGVNATVSAIPQGGNQAYAPEASHRLTGIPSSDSLNLLYFAYWLKGEGKPFPKVTIESCQPQPDGGKQITFSVQAPLPVQTATLYVTAGGESWEAATWEPIAAQAAGENRFQAVIAPGKISKKGAWYVNVSDARPATAGSLVYGMDASGAGPTLRPLGVDPQK